MKEGPDSCTLSHIHPLIIQQTNAFTCICHINPYCSDDPNWREHVDLYTLLGRLNRATSTNARASWLCIFYTWILSPLPELLLYDIAGTGSLTPISMSKKTTQLYLLLWDPPKSLAMTPVVCATLLVRALVSTTLKYRQFVLVIYSPVKLVSFWKVTQLVQFILIQSGKDTDRDFNSMKALTSVACLRLRKMYACFLLLSIGRAVGRVQLLFLVFTYPNWDIVYL